LKSWGVLVSNSDIDQAFETVRDLLHKRQAADQKRTADINSAKAKSEAFADRAKASFEEIANAIELLIKKSAELEFVFGLKKESDNDLKVDYQGFKCSIQFKFQAKPNIKPTIVLEFGPQQKVQYIANNDLNGVLWQKEIGNTPRGSALNSISVAQDILSYLINPIEFSIHGFDAK
jgi:hypothetical protein